MTVFETSVVDTTVTKVPVVVKTFVVFSVIDTVFVTGNRTEPDTVPMTSMTTVNATNDRMVELFII